MPPDQRPSLLARQNSFHAAKLERERLRIERQMLKLEKTRSQRHLILREDRITQQQKQLRSSIEKESFASVATTVMTDSSTSSSAKASCCSSRGGKCEKCARKDRIINRQLHEIASLRQQLYDAKYGPQIPQEIHPEDDASLVSEMNNTFRDGCL